MTFRDAMTRCDALAFADSTHTAECVSLTMLFTLKCTPLQQNYRVSMTWMSHFQVSQDLDEIWKEEEQHS